MKIKIFTGISFSRIEERINDFIEDKTNVKIESHEIAVHGYEDRHYITVSYDEVNI